MSSKKQWTTEAKKYLRRFSDKDSKTLQIATIRAYPRRETIGYLQVTEIAFNLGYDLSSYICA